MLEMVTHNICLASGCEPILLGSDSKTEYFGFTAKSGAREGSGPLGAIIDALDSCDSHVVVVSPNDTPFFSAQDFQILIDSLEQSDTRAHVAVAVDAQNSLQRHWLLSAWNRKSCLPHLIEQFDRGIRSVHQAVEGLSIVDVSFEEWSVRNINHVSDLCETDTI